jgi:hypothetical protein
MLLISLCNCAEVVDMLLLIFELFSGWLFLVLLCELAAVLCVLWG